MLNNRRSECKQCGTSLPESGTKISYGYSNHDVCKKCFDEISAYVNRGWKYEDFWQVEQKYPRIFKQGMYTDKAIETPKRTMKLPNIKITEDQFEEWLARLFVLVTVVIATYLLSKIIS